MQWSACIFDEAHRLKNSKTSLYESAVQLPVSRRFGGAVCASLNSFLFDPCASLNSFLFDPRLERRLVSTAS